MRDSMENSFHFFPLWKRGMKGDLTAFQKAKLLQKLKTKRRGLLKWGCLVPTERGFCAFLILKTSVASVTSVAKMSLDLDFVL